MTKDEDGLVGRLYVPHRSTHARPLVVLGGSEGGTPDFLARPFAEAGYTTMALAYFGEPGLPGSGEVIRLEYCAKALRWLRERPEADGAKPALWGASRGGEAALLVSATFPELVAGTIASVPADTAVCGDESAGLGYPHWSYRGKRLPCSSWPGSYLNYQEAVIPVEQIQSPLLMICGEADPVWPSCKMSRRAVGRLEEDPSPPPYELLAYPGAGHFVSVPPPLDMAYDPTVDSKTTDRAREDVWRATLDFLAHLA